MIIEGVHLQRGSTYTYRWGPLLGCAIHGRGPLTRGPLVGGVHL